MFERPIPPVPSDEDYDIDLAYYLDDYRNWIRRKKERRWAKRHPMRLSFVKSNYRKERRDRDRHDVHNLIALGDSWLYEHGELQEPIARQIESVIEVMDRGIYEHVGRGRRGPRKQRFLAGKGEFNDDIPF